MLHQVSCRQLIVIFTYNCLVKAEENIIFWVAVEFFRVQHISTPNTGATMRKRFSEAVRTPIEDVEEEVLFKINPRHSVMMEQLITIDKLRSLELSEAQVLLICDAARIFKTFLEDGAPHWTCMDVKIVDEIRNKIKQGEVDINIFQKAQSYVFHSMNSDIFPRFVKAILENPQKYSGSERFELPKETIEELEKAVEEHH